MFSRGKDQPYGYRRRWVELRGTINGVTVDIEEFDGLERLERASRAAEKCSKELGIADVHIVECFLCRVW